MKLANMLSPRQRSLIDISQCMFKTWRIVSTNHSGSICLRHGQPAKVILIFHTITRTAYSRGSHDITILFVEHGSRFCIGYFLSDGEKGSIIIIIAMFFIRLVKCNDSRLGEFAIFPVKSFCESRCS